jgi:hypothetical protein
MAIRFLTVGILLSMFFLTSCASSEDPDLSYERPFMYRIGTSFTLWVDGRPTQRIPASKVLDVNGSQDAIVNWKVVTDGKLCLRIEPQHLDLGTYKEAKISIREIRTDRPHTRWRDFRINPPKNMSSYGAPEFQPGTELCPLDLFLTPRLRFGKLPPGQFVLSVRLYGSKNWDMQEVLLIVQ